MPGRRPNRCGAVVLAIGGLIASTTWARAQETAFRAAAEAVVVDVGVYRNGVPVPDLMVEDFEVRDSGVPQTILDLTREALPLDVTLVIDLSQSVVDTLLETLLGAVTRVEASLRPHDRSTLVAFDERIREWKPAGRTVTNGPAPPVPRLGLTSLLDAIATSLPAAAGAGRRAMMIVFTDGADTSSFLDEATVLEMARRTSAAVFVVALAPQRPTRFDGQHDRFFQQISDVTGGRFVKVRSLADVSTAFVNALDAFRQSYVLRYRPRGVDTPGWHDVTVSVTRTGRFEIRARRGYTR